jgi:hypothetical protein
MAPATKPKNLFDVAKLQSMQEPLTLRVERITGNARSPVPLPPRDGAPPGTNWDIASIMDVERWLVMEVAGGGTFELSVTDSAGATMSWSAWWDPRQNTPKTPQTLMQDGVPMSVQPPQQPPGMAPFPTQMQPNWPPAAAQMQMWPGVPMAPTQTAPQYPLAQPYYQPAPYGYPPPSPYGYQGAQRTPYYPPAAPAVDSAAIENRQLQAELQRQREERAAAEHRADLERIQQAHNAQLAEVQRQNQAQMERMEAQIAASQAAARSAETDRLRELEARQERERLDARFNAINDNFTRLAEAITASRAPADDPKLALLQEQLRQQSEAATRDRERQEREQRERDMRAEIRANEEKTQRLIEAATSNRPDPMIALMQENSRNQIESSRLLAQMQQAQMTAMQTQVMPPHQLFQMMRDASSGTDSVLKSAVGVYNDLFGTAKNMFEQMTKMVGGEPEHPAIRIAENIGSSVSKMAERYISGQANKEIQESKAKQEQARAYAQYVAAAQQQTSGIPQPASTAQPAGELNGAQVPQAQPVSQPAAAVTPQATPAAANGAAKPESQGAKVIQLRRLGKTDAEWFDPALADVERLRDAVSTFIAGLAEGKKIGLSPEEAVQFIAQGINHAVAMKVDVKAFTVLFQSERYAEFMDVLLPDAPQSYRDDCVKLIIEMVADSDDEDDDDVDDGDEDDQDGASDDEADAH